MPPRAAELDYDGSGVSVDDRMRTFRHNASGAMSERETEPSASCSWRRGTAETSVAAARVPKNFGFGRLDVVAPREGSDHEEAIRMAVDAADVLAALRAPTRTLDDALLGAATVVGTSRRMGKHRQPHDRARRALRRSSRAWRRRGAVATRVRPRGPRAIRTRIWIAARTSPTCATEPAYPALNVAQTDRDRRATRSGGALDAARSPGARSRRRGLVDHAGREAMYAHLEEALLAIGFLKIGQLEGMMRRLRRILSRAELSTGDVDVVRGIARQILAGRGRRGIDRTAAGHERGRS